MSSAKYYCLLLLLLLCTACGEMVFFGIFGSTVQAQDDIASQRQCSECGMDRKAYGFSRMLLVYADGKEVGVCSLHCAVEAMDRRKDSSVQALRVADRHTHALIPAEAAIWVLGGKKRGSDDPAGQVGVFGEIRSRKFYQGVRGSNCHLGGSTDRRPRRLRICT